VASHAKPISLIGFFLRAIVGLMLLLFRLPAQEMVTPASSLVPADTGESLVSLMATEQGLPETGRFLVLRKRVGA